MPQGRQMIMVCVLLACGLAKLGQCAMANDDACSDTSSIRIIPVGESRVFEAPKVHKDMCWRFRAEKDGYRLRLKFLSFTMYDGYDFFEIGDLEGHHVRPESCLANFSGNALPSDVITMSQGAWIRLRMRPNPPHERTGPRFRVRFIAEKAEVDVKLPCCGELVVIPTSPIPHRNNNFQYWWVKAPSGCTISVTVGVLDVELNYDFVFLTENLHDPFNRSLCRNLTGHKVKEELHKNDFNSSTNNLVIIVTTDHSREELEFHVDLRANPSSACQPPTAAGLTSEEFTTALNRREQVAYQTEVIFLTIVAGASAIGLSVCVIILVVSIRCFLHTMATYRKPVVPSRRWCTPSPQFTDGDSAITSINQSITFHRDETEPSSESSSMMSFPWRVCPADTSRHDMSMASTCSLPITESDQSFTSQRSHNFSGPSDQYPSVSSLVRIFNSPLNTFGHLGEPERRLDSEATDPVGSRGRSQIQPGTCSMDIPDPRMNGSNLGDRSNCPPRWPIRVETVMPTRNGNGNLNRHQSTCDAQTNLQRGNDRKTPPRLQQERHSTRENRSLLSHKVHSGVFDTTGQDICSSMHRNALSSAANSVAVATCFTETYLANNSFRGNAEASSAFNVPANPHTVIAEVMSDIPQHAQAPSTAGAEGPQPENSGAASFVKAPSPGLQTSRNGGACAMHPQSERGAENNVVMNSTIRKKAKILHTYFAVN